MIVMMIAITPSVNASSLVLDTIYPGRLGDGASAAKERPLVWLRPPRPAGTLIRKIHRQLPAASSHPPTKGAIAADTPLNPAHVPIARVRSPGWKAASMIARLAGVISAPPIPCTARAAMSQPMPGAAAHSTGAMVNQPGPARPHPPPPPAVAERAGEQDQRGQGQRVGRDGPLQALEAGVQVPPDRWQRDGDHGGVDPRHRRPATTHRPCADR